MSTSCLFIVSSGLNTDSSGLLIPVPAVDPEGLHVEGCVLELPVTDSCSCCRYKNPTGGCAPDLLCLVVPVY